VFALRRDHRSRAARARASEQLEGQSGLVGSTTGTALAISAEFCTLPWPKQRYGATSLSTLVQMELVRRRHAAASVAVELENRRHALAGTSVAAKAPGRTLALVWRNSRARGCLARDRRDAASRVRTLCRARREQDAQASCARVVAIVLREAVDDSSAASSVRLPRNSSSHERVR